MADGSRAEQAAFGVLDYIIFALTLVISLGIGIYHACSGGKQKTTSEYLVGNRRMKVAPVAISLIVSFESSIMMLGWPGEVYVYGVQLWMISFGVLFTCLLNTQLLVPLFSGLKVVSVFEYLERRFNSRFIRLFGSFLGIMMTLLMMSVVLYGPATALQAVSNFPTWISIFVVALCAIVYTSIGGIKAVIWADAFQFFIMMGGMVAVIIKGSIDAGGMAEVWRISGEGGRLNFFVFDIDPTVRHTFWGLVIGGTIRGMGLGTSQMTIQRIATMPTVNKAKLLMFSVFPGILFGGTLACLEGLVAYAYYFRQRCDPLAAGFIRNPNQIIPYFVRDVFTDLPGMSGLFLAAVFSACLSTLSSGYAAMSTLVWSDFIKPHIPKVSEFRATLIVKGLVVIAGLLSVGMAQIIKELKGPMFQIAGKLMSVFGGPLTGLFLLAAFFPLANTKGALFGGVISMLFSMWLGFGSSFSSLKSRAPYLPPITTSHCFHTNYSTLSDNVSDIITATAPTTPAVEITSMQYGLRTFYSISYMWFAPLGIVLVIVLGLIFSFITGSSNVKDVDPMYLSPFFDRVCCCLPEKIRVYLRCGVDYSEEKRNTQDPVTESLMITKVIPAETVLENGTEPEYQLDTEMANQLEDEIQPLEIVDQTRMGDPITNYDVTMEIKVCHKRV